MESTSAPIITMTYSREEIPEEQEWNTKHG